MPPKVQKPVVDNPSTWYCSFCLRSQHEVRKLVAGPARVSICDGCVDLASRIVAGETPDTSEYPPPDKLPTERLLAQLPAIDSHYRGQGAQLEWAVDLLRARKVSWAAIGEKLGISRQAAWERFS